MLPPSASSRGYYNMLLVLALTILEATALRSPVSLITRKATAVLDAPVAIRTTTKPPLPLAPPLEDDDDRYAIPAHWSRGAHAQRFASRAAPFALAGAVLAAPRSADAVVAGAWSWLRARPWAHAPMFEAWTATFGFVFAIVFWSSAHKLFFRDETRAAQFRFDKRPPASFERFRVGKR